MLWGLSRDYAPSAISCSCWDSPQNGKGEFKATCILLFRSWEVLLQPWASFFFNLLLGVSLSPSPLLAPPLPFPPQQYPSLTFWPAFPVCSHQSLNFIIGLPSCRAGAHTFLPALISCLDPGLACIGDSCCRLIVPSVSLLKKSLSRFKTVRRANSLKYL